MGREHSLLTHSAVQVQQEFTKILASSFITILLEIVPDRNRGWRCSPKSPSKFLLNLKSAVRFCKSQNHKGSLTWCKLHTHHDVFQTDKWRTLFKPRALDGVGNIINNVYSLKHVKYDKDEFIRYNCSQQIDNVNNTHLLGCCLSWSRIVNTEL